jgi:hypothetical protein
MEQEKILIDDCFKEDCVRVIADVCLSEFDNKFGLISLSWSHCHEEQELLLLPLSIIELNLVVLT